MKKICFVTTVSLTMKAFVLESAKYLHNEGGYDVTLICNNDDEFAASLPEYIKFIPVSMARGVDLSVFSSVLAFIKIFKEQNYDMVQFSTPNASLAASIAAKICKVPVRLYCQWGIRYVGFSGIVRKIFKFIEKIVCKNATHINAVSPMNMKFAINEGLYKAKKAAVVGRGGTIGVDLENYDFSKKKQWRKEIREKNSLDENDFVFGFSGRVSADKGCKELFTAFKKLSEEKENIKLFIAGPIDDKSGADDEIFDWAKNSDKVVFTGQIENKEMCFQYAAMDVLVHPTYREGFGMVIQEAAALGCPVITTDIPGASEVLENGKSCLLVKPADWESLYEKMEEICKDSQKATKMGENARLFTEMHYERSIMLKNQFERYKELLK
ncbi:MAG: glycosyltransferase family 4 protein [Clostridia bacterium]|nr:glycosyltransferase family 4 protein [Clostridia bacterium]